MMYRRTGALRRSARVLAAAAVVSSGMMVAGRSNSTEPLPAPPPTGEKPESSFSQPAGEGATPADTNWPGTTASPVQPDGNAVTTDTVTTDAPPPTAGPAAPAPGPVLAQRESSLLPLAQPLWTELTPAQQQALQPFAEEWNTWPAAEKRSWISLSDRLPRMDPAKREKMAQRIAEWARLNPEERRLARDTYRVAKERSSDTRLSEWERYRSMTQEQRSVLREAGTTSNTAARHAGAASGLAKEAAQPLPREPRKPWRGFFDPAPAAPPSAPPNTPPTASPN